MRFEPRLPFLVGPRFFLLVNRHHFLICRQNLYQFPFISLLFPIQQSASLKRSNLAIFLVVLRGAARGAERAGKARRKHSTPIYSPKKFGAWLTSITVALANGILDTNHKVVAKSPPLQYLMPPAYIAVYFRFKARYASLCTSLACALYLCIAHLLRVLSKYHNPRNDSHEGQA